MLGIASSFLLFSALAAFLGAKTIFAAPPPCSNKIDGFDVSSSWPSSPIMGGSYQPINITFFNMPSGTYKMICAVDPNVGRGIPYAEREYANLQTVSSTGNRGTINLKVNDDNCFKLIAGFEDIPAYIKIEKMDDANTACTALNYTLKYSDNSGMSCPGIQFDMGCYEAGEKASWRATGIKYKDGNAVNGTKVNVAYENANGTTSVTVNNGIASGDANISEDADGKTLTVTLQSVVGGTICGANVPIRTKGGCTEEGRKKPSTPVTTGTFSLCEQASNETEKKACENCYEGRAISGKSGIWTAVGCIPTGTQGIVETLLKIGLGLSGGFVVLAILAGSFMFATSAGETKKVQEAQEMITAAIVGLLFVIFSVIILQFIGVNLLQLPGFGTGPSTGIS